MNLVWIEAWIRNFACWILRIINQREHERYRRSLPKCRGCGRHVKSPCHDLNGLHEHGAWDFSCADFLRGDHL